MGKRGNRIRLFERSSENDIRYRGPLSYRHLRMFGWLFLILSQIATILGLAAKVNPELDFGLVTDIISTLSSLTVPLFLIANFSIILTSQNNYKTLLIKYAALMVGTTLLFFYFYEHIIGGVFKTYLGTEEFVFEKISPVLINNGVIAFNIFLDLFLCSLFMFFLDYEPRRFFVGKRRFIFRLFSLLPVIYEVVSIVLKIRAANRTIIISPYLFPLITTKPPLCFLAFLLLGLNMFRTKRKYMKQGNTIGQFHNYLETNANSLRISIRMAIIFVVVAVLDFIVIMAMILIMSINSGDVSNEFMTHSLQVAMASGFGDSISLIFMAPIVLLYSYNRKQKEGLWDSAIPVLGILGCILVYIEGIYRIIKLFAKMHPDLIMLLKQLSSSF